MNDRKLTTKLSPANAWAFAVGTSVGWGSLVVTCSTYLAQAGPAGSILGLLAGTLIMLVIAHNYSYMINCTPDAGGSYVFCRDAFGYDHGFLTAWFLTLTYLAMLWANATSLPLFARYFLGDMFCVGRLYSFFGYDVYLGEALLSAAAILAAMLLCLRNGKLSAVLMTGMVIFFTAGIAVCALPALAGSGLQFSPAFVPEERAVSQILRIAVISPWAFIGFESISHGAEEFGFRNRRIGRIMFAAVMTTALLYILVILLSVSAHPAGYDSWLAYIRDLGNLSGTEALPPFHAAGRYLGAAGIWILMLSLLALVFTSLIGNITAVSRLFMALGRDRILPASFASVNKYGTPGKAVLLASLVSLIIPFVGRTAVGWIVDVTTIGAVLIYGYVSAAAMKTAQFRGDKREYRTGLAGLCVMIVIGATFLLPNLFTSGSIGAESYFLFVIWSAAGFFVFRFVLQHDTHRNFGQSIVVWIALLSMILFVSMVWMNQSVMQAARQGMTSVEEYYVSSLGGSVQSGIVDEQFALVRRTASLRVMVVIFLFMLSLLVLLNNYNLMREQARHSEKQLGMVRDLANRDPLTGVKSKLAYAEKEKELEEMIASGDAEPFAVAVCDINGLKEVNDTLGHKAGDAYIRSGCMLVCRYFEHSPVYRIGGDEFVVLVAGSDYDSRDEIMVELHRTVRENLMAKEVVVAAGIASYPEAGKTLREVFEEADRRMYEEKKLLKSMNTSAEYRKGN